MGQQLNHCYLSCGLTPGGLSHGKIFQRKPSATCTWCAHAFGVVWENPHFVFVCMQPIYVLAWGQLLGRGQPNRGHNCSFSLINTVSQLSAVCLFLFNMGKTNIENLSIFGIYEVTFLLGGHYQTENALPTPRTEQYNKPLDDFDHWDS